MKALKWCCMVYLLGCSFLTVAADQKTCYQVDEIVRVISPLEFECTLKDYPHAKSVRFNVQVPDLEFSEDKVVNEQGVLFLNDLFSKAGRIQLVNVKPRNYFRLKADVLIDDSDLAQLYIANQMASLPKLPEQAPTQKPRQAAGRTLAEWTSHRLPERMSSEKMESPSGRKVQTQKEYLTISDLLDAQVDLSMMNDQTTLEEALDMMTHSVEPTLPLVVLWKDLETNALIEKDMPIGVSGFGQMRLGFALKTVLHSVSTSYSDLVLAPKENILLLGTRQGLQYKPVNRVYSVTDLAALPSFVNQFGNGTNSSGRSNNSSGRSSGNSGQGSSRGRY